MNQLLQKKIVIQGEIEAVTGLHIGGTNSAMGIGGPDSTVVRNPVTNLPYIPGSSLKGKMRSLLEINMGIIGSRRMGDIKNTPSDDPNQLPGQLFGALPSDGGQEQRPSRIMVRDGELLNGDAMTETDLPFTESKTEVVIDRITSKAMPRTLERVPAGARFKLNLVINIFADDDEKELVNATLRCLKMVEDDYLGGSGSRGSGQVRFHIERIAARDRNYYSGRNPEDDLSGSYL